MSQAKTLFRAITILSIVLIAEPLLKVLVLKTQTGLEWSLIWSNIMENSQSFSRFFLFWLISPLTGLLLLTYSSFAYGLYFMFSLFKFYQLLTFTPYSWPYMTKYPHASVILFEVFNLVMFLYLFYPLIQRFILSRYMRKYWDARGRTECSIKGYLFHEGDSEVRIGTIENISSGGVSFVIEKGPQPFKKGKLSFIDPQGTPLSFDVLAKSQRESGTKVTIGFEFLNLAPKDKIYLRTLTQSGQGVHQQVQSKI